ncbi:non-ribosomal peptide synthetase [Robbsia andropogonis]|uniref:non-ribosomal peptide synthetase n=1 Tax=Robbsia andropogonis TaxID=28092 RepID=UPI000467B061|nr:non-ribosomal peptide synthetase [Robbsia andropogonis]
MSTVSFVANLQQRGIRLYAKAGKLAADAAPGVLTAPLIDQIRSRKTEILDLLHGLDAHAASLDDADPTGAAACEDRHDTARNDGNAFDSDAHAVTRLSDGQRQMCLANALPHHASYHMPALFAIDGPLDTDALTCAFADVFRRHETLRTRIVEQGGEPDARIDASAFTLPIATMTENAAMTLARGDADRRFDLATEWPCRVRLLRISEQRHFLSIVLHHVCCDGVSIGILMREIADGYAVARGKHAAEAGAPTRRYADFVQWQNRRAAGKALAPAREYWQRQFARPVPPLNLPADGASSAAQPAGTLRVPMPPALLQALDTQARQHRTTRFTLLVATFAALLGRYAGEEDVVIGTPVANRQHPDWLSLVGFVANTVALRFDCAADQALQAFLDKAATTVRDALAHAELPFEHVLRTAERPGGGALFQAMFAMQPASVATFTLDGLTVRALPLPASQTKFDLTLLVEDSADGAALLFEYRADKYDPAWIADLSRRYLFRLERLGADLALPLGQLALTDEDDLRQLRRAWHGNLTNVVTDDASPLADHRPAAPVHALVALAAARHPDALAVSSPDGDLCYRELDGLANRYAHCLIAAGVRPGDRLGVCLAPSARFLAVVLAAGKVGAAYLPMDPGYPAERLQAMIEDATPPLVIVGEEMPALGGVSQRALAHLHRDAAAHPSTAPVMDTGDIDPMSLPFYVIFTSGSTGRPKGAVVTQRNFVNLLHWYANTFDFHAYTRVLLLSALSFDLTQKNLFAPLLHGGTLVIKSRPDFDASSVVQDIARHHISVVNCTPSMFYAIVEADAANGWHGIATLRHAFLGGEPIAVGPLRDWLLAAPQRTEIVNTYGPTECADVCAFKRLPTSLDHWPAVVPIGQALPGVQLVAVDDKGWPVPDGVVGELLIGGIGVGDGYLGRPELTAERFFTPPFAEPGERFYWTGDLVRRRTDGDYLFLGRRDLQTKLRGFRIELGEIEALLESQPGVARAAATVQRGAAGDERLVAFVIAEPQANIDIASLRTAARQRLPAFAVPQAIACVAALPYTPSGKLDRRALAGLEAGATEQGDPTPFEAPAGPIESLIAQVWRELIGVERISRHDSFFAIGGHSLLATRVVTRLVNQHRLAVDIGDVFSAPTIHALAAQIASRSEVAVVDGTSPTEGAAIVKRAAQGAHPLSPAQQRMLFLARLEGANATYNMSVALRMSGPLDIAALGQALDALVARHPVLAVTFSTQGDQVRQIPQRPAFPALVAEPVADDALETTIQALANQPFDLTRDGTMRIGLLATAADAHVLVMSFHHIVCDGWSAGIIQAELGRLYDAARQHTPPDLPALPVSYFDYADWHREWLSSDRLARLDVYWLAKLSDLPEVSTLPTDYRRPDVAAHAGRTVPFALPDALAARLAGVAREQGASLFMLMLAAFQTLVARLTQRDDVVVGTPVANRLRPELEGLVGLFVNTLVIRQTVDDSQPFTTHLAAAKQTLLDAYTHQDMPFERLVEQLNPPRHLGYAPLFQILFVMDTGALDSVEMSGLTVERIDALPGAAKYDLNVHLLERDGRLSGYVEYDTALFAPSTIARLIEMYCFTLAQITEAPDRPVHALSLLSPALAEELPGHAASQTQMLAPPRDATVAQLVRESAARWPDRPAVTLDGVSRSYAELLAAAETLAGALLQADAPRQAPIGILMHRSIERTAALLGTLVAGCAYVPLDPEWPDERITQIIGAIGINFLIVDSGDRVAAIGFTGHVIVPSGVDGVLRAHRDPTPDDLAYVITTSGSTGIPKSVAVPHRGVAHDLAFLVSARDVVPDDRVLQVTNFNFDPSVRDLFGTWSAGATAVLLPDDVARDPAALMTRLAQDGITKLFSITPTLLRSLLTVAETRGAPAGIRLDTLMPCGERLTAEDCLRAWSVFGDTLSIVNQYGPTEATMTSANHVVGHDDLLRPRIPVGRPNPNTLVWILDAHQREVPVGTFGEVYIDGIGITRGYANDPVRTREAFVPNPFATGRGYGPLLYRTGDVGRRLDDGSIDLMGRIDAQVKIRGNRVEPGEIEAALGRIPAVEHAAVKVFEDADGQPQLAAYVVLNASVDEPEYMLRRHLARELPAYMVPVSLQAIAAMPTTITGKIDRQRLPAPRLQAAVPVSRRATTPTEVKVAAIWAEILVVPEVDTRTNFFELGGNSLRLIAVQAGVLTHFGLELPVVELFRYPTVELLASRIDARSGTQAAPHGAGTEVFSTSARRRIEQRKQRQSGAHARRQRRNNDA